MAVEWIERQSKDEKEQEKLRNHLDSVFKGKRKLSKEQVIKELNKKRWKI